jgi:hypothetical protein
MRTRAAIARHPDWREALADLIGQIPLPSGEHEVHLALLFASTEYRPEHRPGDPRGGRIGPSTIGLRTRDSDIVPQPETRIHRRIPS